MPTVVGPKELTFPCLHCSWHYRDKCLHPKKGMAGECPVETSKTAFDKTAKGGAEGKGAMLRFTKGQAVMLSLLDQEGQPKNDFARVCPSYYHAQSGVVARWVDTGTIFVFQVRMDDGAMLQLTEDCLVPVNGPV
jgi:hypothetical protein